MEEEAMTCRHDTQIETRHRDGTSTFRCAECGKRRNMSLPPPPWSWPAIERELSAGRALREWFRKAEQEHGPCDVPELVKAMKDYDDAVKEGR